MDLVNLQYAILFLLATSSAMARVGDGWGVNIHWTEGSQNQIQLVSGAYRVARMDFSWGGTEKSCGSYDFSAYDRLLNSLSPVGVKNYWILDYANNCYDGGKFVTSPAGIAAFSKWIQAAVKHFAGRGIIWECYNEPNCNNVPAEIYSRGFLPALMAVKSEFPNEIIVGPTVCGVDLNFINTTFYNGLIKYWNMVSVHPYRNEHPEVVLSDYASVTELIRKYNSNAHVISGEWGYTTPPGNMPCSGNCVRADLLTQAKYLARMWLFNAMNGNPVSIWYDFSDDGPRDSNAEHNFGTLFQDLSPKPSYVAAKTLQWSIGNGTYANRVSPSVPDNSVYILEFSDISSDASAYAIWTTNVSCSVSNRKDCGFNGISESECLSRGCCFDEVEKNPQLPQCYFSTTSNVEFQVNAKSGSQCFSVTSVLGAKLNNACASDHTVNVAVTDGPTYLIPVR